MKFSEIKTQIYELFIRVRCRIDNEVYRIPILRGKSISDEFSDKILREIEIIMRQERFDYQNGKTLMPTKYLVSISSQDDIDWYGKKREALERKVMKFLTDRLSPLSAQATMMGLNYEVKILSSNKLKKGEVKVQHHWEEKDKPLNIHINGNFFSNVVKSQETEGTTDWLSDTFVVSEAEDDDTIINTRSKKLFSIEIQQNGIFQEVIPIFQSEVRLGRGSNKIPVEIVLQGDGEISRLHGILRKKTDGQFVLSIAGKKPVIVKNQLFSKGQTTPVNIGEIIQIGSYSLHLRE